MYKRFIYFFYYLKKLDWQKFRSFVNHVAKTTNRSKVSIVVDAFSASVKYNISILDYFYFDFYKIPSKERDKFAGTGAMYEYQLKMNPKESRNILENKATFLKRYEPFVERQFFFLNEIKENSEGLQKLLDRKPLKLVVKLSTGQVGAEVEIIPAIDLTPSKLINLMESRGFDLVEEFVVQHPDLMSLSPSGLNTLRLITQLVDDEVHFLGARLRVSVNSPVDNMAAGNLACPVDLKTGKIIGPGVYSDITKADEIVHPVTKVMLEGFQIPFWDETIDMVQRAARHDASNRSIGWDVALSESGPELIEGNHNWCKLLWQLPIKKGLKLELEKYS